MSDDEKIAAAEQEELAQGQTTSAAIAKRAEHRRYRADARRRLATLLARGVEELVKRGEISELESELEQMLAGDEALPLLGRMTSLTSVPAIALVESSLAGGLSAAEELYGREARRELTFRLDELTWEFLDYRATKRACPDHGGQVTWWIASLRSHRGKCEQCGWRPNGTCATATTKIEVVEGLA